MDRDTMHREAERIFRSLDRRFGAEMPEDVRTVLSYYAACRAGFDRAAEHVLLLKEFAR